MDSGRRNETQWPNNNGADNEDKSPRLSLAFEEMSRE